MPLRLGPDGAIELDSEPAANVDQLIAQLLGSIHTAQLTGEWKRLKISAADDCRWAFCGLSPRTAVGSGAGWTCAATEFKNRRYRAAQAWS